MKYQKIVLQKLNRSVKRASSMMSAPSNVITYVRITNMQWQLDKNYVRMERNAKKVVDQLTDPKLALQDIIGGTIISVLKLLIACVFRITERLLRYVE